MNRAVAVAVAVGVTVHTLTTDDTNTANTRYRGVWKHVQPRSTLCTTTPG